MAGEPFNRVRVHCHCNSLENAPGFLENVHDLGAGNTRGERVAREGNVLLSVIDGIVSLGHGSNNENDGLIKVDLGGHV